MSNEQKQPQEGKPLGAAEMINEYMKHHKDELYLNDCKKLMEQYAAQQTAAFREELERVKADRKRYTEMFLSEKNLREQAERIYNIEHAENAQVVEELEAVKKERDNLKAQCVKHTVAFGFERMSHQKVIAQRDEAVKLLKDRILHDIEGDFLNSETGELYHSDIPYHLLPIWRNEIITFLSRMASREMNLREIPNSSPWISVEDRLPSKNCSNGACVFGYDGKTVSILTYTTGREIDVDDYEDELDDTRVDRCEESGIAWLKQGWYELEEQSSGAYDQVWIKRDITHWMPLPAPPESLNDKK